jgi:hypothetical protein
MDSEGYIAIKRDITLQDVKESMEALRTTQKYFYENAPKDTELYKAFDTTTMRAIESIGEMAEQLLGEDIDLIEVEKSLQDLTTNKKGE